MTAIRKGSFILRLLCALLAVLLTVGLLSACTDTPESKSALGTVGYNNYIIKVVGTKIVITSPSEYALESALSEFISYLRHSSPQQ